MLHVVDARSNVNDNIFSAAEFLGSSQWRRDIFREIYRGKRKAKTAEGIATRLGCTPQEGADDWKRAS